MTTLRYALLTLAILHFAAPAVARTWRVEKDGTGDFSILYEAADACAAGDTILIGPGRFEEYRREPDYQWNAYCCVHFAVSGVTVVGSGPDVTFIGFEHYDPHYEYWVIGISCFQGDLNIKDLTVTGLRTGYHFEGTNLHVEHCNLIETRTGVATWSTSSTLLERCRFIDMQSDGVLGAYPVGATITECEFTGGRGGYSIAAVGGSGWEIRNCTIQNCTGGIQFEQGARGIVEGCVIHVAGGNSPAIGILTGSVITLFDNSFRGEHWAGSFLTNGTTVTAYNNVFQGGDYTSIEIGLTPMDFRGNHVLNGGGMSVLALWERGSLNQPYDLDLADNYWGTTDAAQIAAWIDDYNDHPPMDNYHYVIVDFQPFEDQPVQTEQTSWGTVKSLFR